MRCQTAGSPPGRVFTKAPVRDSPRGRELPAADRTGVGWVKGRKEPSTDVMAANVLPL